MASKISESEPSLDPERFTRAQIVIESVFQSLMQKLVEKRDQLLEELHQMEIDFLSKEEIRLKHVKDLDQLISGIEQISVEQNLIVKKQEEHIQGIKREKREFQIPTPKPFPKFFPHELEDLQRRIDTFGTLQDVAAPYNTKTQPLKSVGKSGGGKLEFKDPYSIALDGKGNMYIADCLNSRIQVVSIEGQFVREFGKGELDWPYGLSLHKECLFVTDCLTKKVLKYKISNCKLECKSEFELNIPSGIAADDDEVFIADCDKNRIVVLNLELKLIREFGNSNLIKPRDVKVNMNKLFVANNSKSFNVLVFTKLGDLINSIIRLMDGTYDIFMCFDKFNNILISDYSSKSIQIFTIEGHLVHSIECGYYPTGIAVTQDNIIICDDLNSKINVY